MQKVGKSKKESSELPTETLGDMLTIEDAKPTSEDLEDVEL